jgi:hypothetical protein
MGRPNLQAHLGHIQATQAAMQRKQQMAQMQAEQAANGGQPSGQPGQPQADARNVASLKGVEQQGGMGDVNMSPAATNGSAGGPQPAAGRQ